MARNLGQGGKITSIELDEERYKVAQNFVDQSDYASDITLLLGDASDIIPTLEGPFDMVFLDGPKGQYLHQLKALMPRLTDNAVILADNVLFRGYVRGEKEAPRRYKTITKRLQDYLKFVENKEVFNTTIYPMGDGMSVSIWKGLSNG